MQSAKSRISLLAGPSLSGAGGALLVLMFFMPWFSVSYVRFNGEELAFGKTLLGSSSGPGIYPWLALPLLVGLVALALAGVSFFVQAETLRRPRPFILLGAGGLAGLIMTIVLFGFLKQMADAGNSGLAHVEYGFLGEWAAVLLILSGGSWDLAQVWTGRGQTQRLTQSKPADEAYVPAAPVQNYIPPGPSLSRLNQAMLRGTAGVLAGRTIQVQGDGITLGRSSENQVHVPDSQASRRHAVIRYAQGNYFLQDQQSTHGTLLNGQPIEASILNDGDLITIGETTLEFRVVE